MPEPKGESGRRETVYNIKGAIVVWAHNASCDPAEIAHLDQEMARKHGNIGVGVIDIRTGQVQIIPFDDTDAFSMANPHLQLQAGHESAAAMAAIPRDQARGFVLGNRAMTGTFSTSLT